MDQAFNKGAGMRALVTGGTGFVGSHVVRTLVEQELDVRVLVRPTSDLTGLNDLTVRPILGDLTDDASLAQAVHGIDVLFHVAADYRFWVPDPAQMEDVNVGGTCRVLDAALKAGVGRIVYTSSTVTVSSTPTRLGIEEAFVRPEQCRSLYQRTKVMAEQAVWERIRQGAPITIVNPSTPIGSWDRKPTPTGRLIVDFLNGRLPAYVDAEFNWISVRDVAMGHWLAFQHGRIGERYILGHENLPLGHVLALLGEVSQLPPPRIKIPYAVAFLAGAFGEAWGRVSGREPRASVDGVRMAGSPMRYDSRKAVKELGLPQTALRVAMEEAVSWFRTHGYVMKGGRS
jgi:dihydroflavonol-4-reductase